MNDLTVGFLEEKIRSFDKGTKLHLGCGCCNHSSSGGSSILNISDKTDQTFGYVELTFNDAGYSDVRLSKDKEEFYIKEIEKLKLELQKEKKKVSNARECFKSIQRDVDMFDKMNKYLEVE